jgi:hypothetical protein
MEWLVLAVIDTCQDAHLFLSTQGGMENRHGFLYQVISVGFCRFTNWWNDRHNHDSMLYITRRSISILIIDSYLQSRTKCEVIRGLASPCTIT